MVEAEKLGLNPELLKRGLNDGFSGGEKKKMEILQLLVFGPKYVILDEIDSGLDIDALKKIATTMEQVAKKMKVGVLVITHYNRILKYLKADKVVVFENGKVTRTGGASLAKEVENKGYLPENNE
jgi:Fe-S cluster assembly ATP-binding protein